MLVFDIAGLKFDTANRIRLPSRNQLFLNEEVVVGRIPNNDNIIIFTQKEFIDFTDKVDGFPVPGSSMTRRARRQFYSKFFPEKVDKQSRLRINRKLMKGGVPDGR